MTGLSSLKVRFRAGLELYRHFDSTNLSRASLATSSDTVGTLGEKTHTSQRLITDSSTEWFINKVRRWWCALPDVGHQRVPVEFRLGVVGRGRWIQRVISLCTNTDTQTHRRGRFRNVKEEKQKSREDDSRRTSSFVTLVSMDVIQPAGRRRWRSLLWYVWIERTWEDEEQKNVSSLIWDDGWSAERVFLFSSRCAIHLFPRLLPPSAV